MIHFYP